MFRISGVKVFKHYHFSRHFIHISAGILSAWNQPCDVSTIVTLEGKSALCPKPQAVSWWRQGLNPNSVVPTCVFITSGLCCHSCDLKVMNTGKVVEPHWQGKKKFMFRFPIVSLGIT